MLLFLLVTHNSAAAAAVLKAKCCVVYRRATCADLGGDRCTGCTAGSTLSGEWGEEACASVAVCSGN
jgi:hypothetical protein